MALSDTFMDHDIHPIDIVEHIAASQDWTFERIAEDQISMAVHGQWRSYAVTLAWCEAEESLRLVCTFEMEPPKAQLPALYEVLNLINDQIWTGAFTYWAENKMMIYRYGLVLSGGQMAVADQIDTMVQAAVANAERFYPALQLVVWGGRSAPDALQIAIAETFGRA